MEGMEQVPARRSVDVIRALDTPQFTAGMGNYHADLGAKQALGLHPQPPPGLAKDVEETAQRVRTILRIIADVLVLFPAERFERQALRSTLAPERRRQLADQPADAHCWQLDGKRGLWHCTQCMLSRAASAQQVAKLLPLALAAGRGSCQVDPSR